MKIRNKILLYFSATSIIMVGLFLSLIYWMFSEYREEEFQQRQKEKILSTLQFISEVEKSEKDLTEAIDRLTINSFMNEKLLIFDSSKNLVYASLDDVPISYSDKLLSKLNDHKDWIEQKDGLYDVVAIYFTSNNKSYYGISKAFDEFGYTKLSFLRNLLLIVFIVFSTLVIVLSIYLSNRISRPIAQLAMLLSDYEIGKNPINSIIQTNTFEIKYLNTKFNELVSRTNEAYNFQKNSIHHISHQLKTPIAVLISELERIRKKTTDNVMQQEIDAQIAKTRSLADIINILLEISKIESGQSVNKKAIRADELIFDCISELNMLYPEFVFEVSYYPDEPDMEKLTVFADEMLIRQAFQNLLNNCVAYSDERKKAEIKIDCSNTGWLALLFINTGQPVSDNESAFLFSHFFRGENSRSKAGFGLGLTLTRNIIELHKGSISYSNPSGDINIFEVRLPMV
ncbi:MAG: HAMP domain-containing sensor histidine kinase [Niabella sp.]